MSKRDLRQALIDFLGVDESNTEAAADALTDVMCAFGGVLRGEPMELAASDTPALILAELRTQTAMLRRIADFELDSAHADDLVGKPFDVTTSGLPG